MFIHPALHMNSRLSGAFPGSKEKEEKRMKLSENEYQNYIYDCTANSADEVRKMIFTLESY